MGYGRETGATRDVRERVAAHRSRMRAIVCPEPADMRRRKRLENDPPKWLQHYMATSYPYPFSSGHKLLIDAIWESAHTGEATATAQPRGEGKSSICRGMGFLLQARALIRFPVLVGWKHMDASQAFRMWLQMLCSSPVFAADYPEFATPFTVSTHATALKNLTWANTIAGLDVAEGERTGATVDTMHKVITLPNSIGAIAARSAKGDAKGLNATLQDGAILRPDFLLIDDAQDVAMAGNPAALAKTVDVIENVFFGMAGPQKRLSAAIACTVEAREDVSEYWLTQRGIKSIRVSRVERWPDGSTGGTWESKKGCPIRAAWDEWREIYLDQGQRAANKCFNGNRKAMTGKMQVSWKHRFEKGKDVCAIDAAMHDWYKLGEDVFSRGQQNRPMQKGVTLFTLAPKDIVARVDKSRAPGDVPEWVRKIVAATDVNRSYALSTAVLGFGEDQRAAVLWYGLHEMTLPDHPTDAQTKAYIMQELEKHGQSVAGLRSRPDLWLIDGGGSPQDTVQTFCANAPRTCGLDALTAFGRAWNYFRAKQSDRKFEQAIIRSESRLKRWALYNKDYWQDIAIRAWLAAIGAPGSCDMPTGSHRNFAEQVCNERLIDKAPLAGGWAYKWEGVGPHDFGDCVYMAFVGAALLGIGTGGVLKQIEAPKKTGPWGANRPRWGANRTRWGAK